MDSTSDPYVEAIASFTTRAERAASVVHRIREETGLAELISRLASESPVALSPAFLRRYPAVADRVGGIREALVPSTAEEAARAAVGVSVGEALVVETGSVLVAERDLPDRLVSMLSPILVQVVDARRALRSLDEVGDFIQQGIAAGGSSYYALVTGPSRSADIERSLTIGVQGPAELHIVLYETG